MSCYVFCRRGGIESDPTFLRVPQNRTRTQSDSDPRRTAGCSDRPTRTQVRARTLWIFAFPPLHFQPVRSDPLGPSVFQPGRSRTHSDSDPPQSDSDPPRRKTSRTRTRVRRRTGRVRLDPTPSWNASEKIRDSAEYNCFRHLRSSGEASKPHFRAGP